MPRLLDTTGGFSMAWWMIELGVTVVARSTAAVGVTYVAPASTNANAIRKYFIEISSQIGDGGCWQKFETLTTVFSSGPSCRRARVQLARPSNNQVGGHLKQLVGVLSVTGPVRRIEGVIQRGDGEVGGELDP